MGGSGDFRLLGNECRGIEKAQRRLGRDDPNRVTKLDERLVKFGGPNRSHGAGHSQKDVGHGLSFNKVSRNANEKRRRVDVDAIPEPRARSEFSGVPPKVARPSR